MKKESNKNPVVSQSHPSPESSAPVKSGHLSAQEYEEKVGTLLENGETFDAYNLATKGLERYPDNLTLREYGALALLRTGAASEAHLLIEPILSQVFYEPALGQELMIREDSNLPSSVIRSIALVYQSLWYNSRDNEELRRSRALYLYHFEKTEALMSGACAACLSWLLGEDIITQELAKRVKVKSEALKSRYEESGMEAFDLFIALGLAYLLLGDQDLANAMFTRAQQVGGGNYPLIVAALKQMKIFHEGGLLIPTNIFESLKPPTIVVFTGQMIDHPGPDKKRFMPGMEGLVRAEIRHYLDSIDAKIGFSSASCGSDILFLEEMLERDGEINIILPFDQEDFLSHNVRFAGPRWEARFHKVMEKAHSISFATTEKYLGHDMLYRFSNMMIQGLSEARGNFLLTLPHLLAVWDSEPDSLVGGAADFIDHWPDISRFHLIDLDGLKEQYVQQSGDVRLPSYLQIARQEREPVFESLTKTSRTIKSMLFSDFAGFSKLREEHIPGFINFMGELKRIMGEVAPTPESINTWGDAIFAVATDATDLAEYALLLSELVQDISTNTRGLPPINVRVSLHAGPVYEAMDPFREQKNYYGGHINRGARLEPVTVVGQVYATEQFIALLTAEESQKRAENLQEGKAYIQRFTCEYVGVVELAKGFGSQPVYHLRWL